MEFLSPGSLADALAAKAATAITIALRVPILLNCWGPVAGRSQTAVISSSGRPACCLTPV